jgi:hypothetical protein
MVEDMYVRQRIQKPNFLARIQLSKYISFGMENVTRAYGLPRTLWRCVNVMIQYTEAAGHCYCFDKISPTSHWIILARGFMIKIHSRPGIVDNSYSV